MNPIQSLLKPAIPITGVPVVKEKKPIATVHTRVQIFSQLRLLLKNEMVYLCSCKKTGKQPFCDGTHNK